MKGAYPMDTIKIKGLRLFAYHGVNPEEKRDGQSRGNVLGCYIHGLFDRGESAAALVNCLLRARGLSPQAAAVDWAEYQRQQYDKLAAGLRSALDMDRIYRILNKEE